MAMKKIGREVLYLPKGENNPRNGEGSFIRLKNGAILYGYTEYVGDSAHDHASARFACFTSYDEGETWTDKRVLLEMPPNCKNIMSLSFLRMKAGDIGAFYILKELDGSDKILLVRSSDEGMTWSEPLNCFACLEKDDYYVLNNDRVITLKSGRILFSVARHTIHSGTNRFMPGEICFFYSDDDGATWKKTDTELKSYFPNDGWGYREPGLYQLPDGRIWCFIRTGLGRHLQSFSNDDGITWSPVELSWFTAPDSPLSVRAVGKYTAAIFNPQPDSVCRDREVQAGRTPFVCAVSEGNGMSFSRIYCLDDVPTLNYCYAAIFEGEDYFLAGYYAIDYRNSDIHSHKIVKVSLSEIAE